MSAPPPPDVVEPLHPSGIAEAATVLAAALADDPGFVHLFPVRARRERELRAMYRMTLSDSVQHGHAFVTRLDGVVTGAIALYPPGAYPMTPVRWWRMEKLNSQVSGTCSISRIRSATSRSSTKERSQSVNSCFLRNSFSS